MAEKKDIVLERMYVVPLRRIFMRAPKWKRTLRAIKGLREFAMHHMKSEVVRLDSEINDLFHKHGIQNPPPRIKVMMKKDSEGTVRVSLPESEKKAKKKEKEAKKPALKKEEKKPEPKKEAEKK